MFRITPVTEFLPNIVAKHPTYPAFGERMLPWYCYRNIHRAAFQDVVCIVCNILNSNKYFCIGVVVVVVKYVFVLKNIIIKKLNIEIYLYQVLLHLLL